MFGSSSRNHRVVMTRVNGQDVYLCEDYKFLARGSALEFDSVTEARRALAFWVRGAGLPEQAMSALKIKVMWVGDSP